MEEEEKEEEVGAADNKAIKSELPISLLVVGGLSLFHFYFFGD